MEGLWTVEFGSNAGLFGSGVIVLRNGIIQGGDESYYYFGSYEPTTAAKTFPARFKAKIKVTPYLAGRQSVFSTFDKNLTLVLDGTIKDENSAVAVGTPEGMPEMSIGVRLTRKIA